MTPSEAVALGANLSVDSSVLESLSVEQKARLTDVLDRYLCAVERGVPPDPEPLLEEHPDLAELLEVYLKSLMELHDLAAGFASPDSRGVQAAPPENDEKRLGDFILLREIGRGGMGVVYEARQLSLGRRVALKVLPFAAVLDSQQIARFKNEAQAAAQLHHPNIVPVFAVGADRGVHYYAMQFIDGQPLDRAIGQLRSQIPGAPACGDLTCNDLTLPCATAETAPRQIEPAHRNSFLSAEFTSRPRYFRAVTRLAIQAADALHAAHEYGVVHRDIKPSNLLLDNDGKLWVTDFGLARYQSDLAITKTGDVVGTRRYMSPEQAAGQAALVDQRTDVYSLGVTLYELLTLQPAFGGDDAPTLMRQIEEHEPIRPRKLQPLLPVDLETVVLKAMARSREDRYVTAEELAEDLRRVLDGRPTIARPPTIPDRIGRWTRRYARAVAGVAALGLLAVIGLTTATLLITREKTKAEQNYARAEHHFRQAQDTVDRFGARLAERLAGLPGADDVRRELLEETLEYYHGFVEQAAGDSAPRADLAMTYSKIGTLAHEIGSEEEAIGAHESAVKLLEQLVAEKPAAAAYRRSLGTSENNLALAMGRAGHVADARRAYGRAIEIQQALIADLPDEPLYRGDLALAHNNLGLLESQQGALDEAGKSFREAIRLQTELIALVPNDPEMLRNLAASYNNLGGLSGKQQPAEAAQLYTKALGYQVQASRARPSELKYQSDLALTFNNLGAAHAQEGRLQNAASAYRRAIEIQQLLTEQAPLYRSYRRALAVSYNNLGLTQSRLASAGEAERSFRHALELEEALVSQNPHDLELHSSLGGIHNNLGIVLEQLDRLADATDNYRKAVEHQQEALAGATTIERYRSFLSKHYYNYGRALRKLGRGEDAARAALARKQLWPKDPQRLYSVAEEMALASNVLAERHSQAAGLWRDRAIGTLGEAVAAGFEIPSDLRSTEAFAALRDNPRFMSLVKK